MGKVQKKLGRLHEALANFNQALDLDPKAGNMIKAHIDRLQVKLICALREGERYGEDEGPIRFSSRTRHCGASSPP